MIVFPHIEDDANLSIHISAIQRIEAADDIVRGQIDVAGRNHGGETEAEVGIAARHHRIGSAHVEIIPE